MSGSESVLTKKARPAWQLLGFIALIAASLIKIIDWDRQHSMAVAQEVVQPVDSLVKAHLQEVAKTQKVMEDFAADQKKYNDKSSKILMSLCQATPKARCDY